MNLTAWFNPTRFMRVLNGMFWPLIIIAVWSLFAGLHYGLIASPEDYQQKDAVRIMYVHVPAAWFGMMCYGIMASFGAGGLIWKNPFSHMVAYAIAPIGMVFTLLCLITGALWGKPIWNAWWVWDARLTSMLLLFFFYAGYIALYNGFDDQSRGQKMASILLVVGVVNLPVIKFSVEWWNTLHQPASILRSGGVSIHSSMLTPLLWMALFYFCFMLIVMTLRLRTMLLKKKAR